MRLGLALCRGVFRVNTTRLTLPSQRRGLFTLKSKNREIDRLKTDLEKSLKTTDKQQPAQIHTALASAYLKERNTEEALKHAYASYEVLKKLEPKPVEQLFESSRVLVEVLTLREKFAEALEIAEEGASLARSLLKPTDIQLARSLYGLSFLKATNGKIREAEPICTEVVSILRKTPDKAFLADALKSLGVLQQSSNRLEDAANSLSEAVEILRSAQNYEAMPMTLTILADVYGMQGKLKSVRNACEKALEALRMTPGKNLELLSQILERLMSLAVARNDAESAHKYAVEKSELDLQLRPKDEKLHGMNWFSLGMISINRNNDKEARMYLDKALAIMQDEGPMRVKTMNLLCKTCLALEDLEAANTHAEKMLEEAKQIPEYPDLAGIYLDYGSVKDSRNEDQVASESYEKCISLEASKPTDRTAFAYINLGQLHAKSGNYAQASECYKKGCELYIARTKGDSPEVPMMLHNLALMQASAEQLEDAESTLLRSLDMKVRLYGKRSDSIAETRQALASIYVRKDKNEAAEEQLRKGLEEAEGENAKALAGMLVSVLERQGKHADAEAIAKQYPPS